MRRVTCVETGHQRVEVWKSAHEAEFRVAGAAHAWWHRSRYLTGLAWDLIAAGALLGRENPRSVLMLGLAGGTAFRTLRHLLPEAHLAAVDIDVGIIELARQHMSLDALDIHIHLGDAYEWLAANRHAYDVVIDDIYLAGKTDVFRARAWDPALIEHLRRAVAPDGVLAVNLVTGPGHRTMQSATRRHLREAFPVVKSLGTPEAQNEVLAAGRRLAGKQRLAGFAPAFEHWRDLDYWRRISVRRL